MQMNKAFKGAPCCSSLTKTHLFQFQICTKSSDGIIYKWKLQWYWVGKAVRKHLITLCGGLSANATYPIRAGTMETGSASSGIFIKSPSGQKFWFPVWQRAKAAQEHNPQAEYSSCHVFCILHILMSEDTSRVEFRLWWNVSVLPHVSLLILSAQGREWKREVHFL